MANCRSTVKLGDECASDEEMERVKFASSPEYHPTRSGARAKLLVPAPCAVHPARAAAARRLGRTVEYDLYLVRMVHEVYPGASMPMWGFSLSPDDGSGSVPGPTLRVTEGDTILVHFHPGFSGYNHTLHFHGQNVPNDEDGVPFE